MMAGNSISWAQLDGAGRRRRRRPRDTDATLDEPRGMMIDPVTDRLYWSNFADGLGTTIS